MNTSDHASARNEPVPSARAAEAAFILVNQMDIPAELEAEFNRLYDHEHLPQILGVPGVRAAYRYKLETTTQDGTPTYLAIYHIDHPDVMQSREWREAADSGEWAPRIRPHTHNRQKHLFRNIG